MERFWNKVDKKEDGCWEWTASVRGYGNLYGQFRLGKRTVSAHRFAYELVVGEIPEGMVLDHLCRNTKCVNPSHLEPVLQRVNCQRGIATPLDETKVKRIREMYEEGKSFREIGREFGVSRVCIDYIVKGKRWNNV